MPGISKSGNKTHDDAVLASEVTLQAAIAGSPTQATLNTAYTTHFAAVRDSAITNGLTNQAAYFENARRQLANRAPTPHDRAPQLPR